MWSVRQSIEVFHLLFLRALAARVNPGLFVLKGGCNLRFYFKSIRYSEDLDLDIRTMAVATLRNNVTRLLESQALAQTLRAQGLEVEDARAVKQTETTQRWKLHIRTAATPHPIPTKLEFSRHGLDADYAHAPVDAGLIARYHLYPVVVQHYLARSALKQKIEALAQRQETQARDVFDLKLLFDAGATLAPRKLSGKQLVSAIENAMAIGYDDFAGQVLAFLEPEDQRNYKTKKAWNSLQDEVVRALEGLRL
jgi:predicted nucleotidyltransferase component of viral defense system